MSLVDLIHNVTETDGITAALTAGRELRRGVSRETDCQSATRHLVDGLDRGDALSRYMMIAALGVVPDRRAGDALAALLANGDQGIREHAAWALADVPPVLSALDDLVDMVALGGFPGMLAQMTIEAWVPFAPATILDEIESALRRSDRSSARARLVETSSLVKTPAAQRLLVRCVKDVKESWEVRAAAISGLDRRGAERCRKEIEELCYGPNVEVALAGVDSIARHGGLRGRRVLNDVAAGVRGPSDALLQETAMSVSREPFRNTESPSGLRVAQVVLQGRLDKSNSGAGVGDSGGLATLMAGLGRALGQRPEIGRSYIIGRALQGPNIPVRYSGLEEPIDDSSVLMRSVFAGGRDLAVGEMWTYRVAIERSLDRLHKKLGGLDAVHLRFADAGTLAAWRVFRHAGVPVFFSLAPDPHVVIQTAESKGSLDRETFPAADRREHYLFRARLVEEIAQTAHGLALFPRPDQSQMLVDLVGLDLDRPPRHQRIRTVPEGINPEIERRATALVQAAARGDLCVPVLSQLMAHVAKLSTERRGLPLLISVGRLHPVKGFPRLVEAWSREPDLRDRFNLVIVGGDLGQPNRVEHEVLAKIEDILKTDPPARDGLILLGHQSNESVASLLAVTRLGLEPGIGSKGVFVCASYKEEFGLAILESMASGLPVVAPGGSGPATYLRDGENGFLFEPRSTADLRCALVRATARRGDEVLTRRARATIIERYTVEKMAEALADLYIDRPAERVAQRA